MKQYFLKTSTEAEMSEALSLLPEGSTIDIIGQIYKPTGVMLTDEEGTEYPEMAAIEGFHANVIAEITEEQEASLPLIDAPGNPYRVFGGM